MDANKPQKYHVRTYGCQANIADSSTIAGVLESLGFEVFPEPKGKNEDEKLLKVIQNCDLLIINTCSVRQKSEDKVYGIGKLLKLPNVTNAPRDDVIPHRKLFIIMAGCMVGSVTGERQRYEFEELKKRTPWVDEYINPSQIMNIPNILFKNKKLSEWASNKFKPRFVENVHNDNTHGFINISYGCDNFCTFCVVPYARGAEVSRSEKEVISEIIHLTKRGFTEFTLCGQNVNSWGLTGTEKFEIRTGSDQKLPFADLLRKIHKIEGVNKINFISSNPFDFTNDLIEAIQLPKISDYIHIAAQSGNNDILKKMNRRHTVEEFITLANKIKEVKPTVELGTDIIVGFPTETREQFMDTVKLFEQVKFNVAFISIYSPRKGTPAEKYFKDDVSRDEKKWRHAYLTEVWNSTKGKKG